MKCGLKIFLIAGLCLVSTLAMAQQVTAPFLAQPPVIDGAVSAGEWDGAAVVEGAWSAHDSDSAATLDTTVRVAYSIDAVYFLYECEDPNVQSSATGTEYYNGLEGIPDSEATSFTFAGETDYAALYIDPANVPDDAPNASFYSYSIQWEPSITAKNESDPRGNSYNYTELGQYGGATARFLPPLEDVDGNKIYWAGGLVWQGDNIQIVDGPTANGYVCEVRIPYKSFSGYWRNFFDMPLDLGDNIYEVIMNSDASDPFYSQNGSFRTTEISEDETVAAPIDTGIVTGMPAPGTVWKVQFCRFSDGDLGYVNWVGDTGGFVTRPFGDLIFGEATGADIAEALLHLNN